MTQSTNQICPQCQSKRTTFNSDHGYYACEECNAVWALDKDDPDYDENSENLVQIKCIWCERFFEVPEDYEIELVTTTETINDPTSGDCNLCHAPIKNNQLDW